MILYHTSDRDIKNPDIHRGRKNADFGWGFYLTPDKDFTYRWAREKAVRSGSCDRRPAARMDIRKAEGRSFICL